MVIKMAKIRTLFKDISPNEAGFTLVHEHLYSHPPLWKISGDPDLLLDDVEKNAQELKLFHKAGGKTIVDATTIDYGRSAKALIEIANKVPEVNIISVTGFNLGSYYEPWVYEYSLDDIVELLKRDITIGMEGTNARSGLLKIGTSYNYIMKVEEKTLRAAAKVHVELGTPIVSHTTLGTMAHEQIELLLDEGVDLGKVAFYHMDHNLDFWYQKKILEKGAYIVYDCTGKIKYGPEEWRINMLKRLIKAGFLEQLMIAGDTARRSYYKSYGGGPGLDYIPTKYINRLREEGFTQEMIDIIFIENPKRFLSW